jgi:Xaa-Pro aminopeptidase
VELVRRAGARVASSGDLVQALEAVLSPAQARQHRRTARDLHEAVHDAFGFIGKTLKSGRRLTEYDVQRRLLSFFHRRDLTTNGPPIVAVNANSARPHYTPSVRKHSPVRKGDWVLIDLWAKPKGTDAVYADITWCAYAGPSVPGRHEEVFQVVRAARDAAVGFIARKEGDVSGWQVDRAARAVIEKAGYGKAFIHRTGHSIGTEDHANGANMDSLETRETRRLLPGALFSIEPGIYLRDFGARSEINVFMDGRRPVVTTPAQAAVVPLLR